MQYIIKDLDDHELGRANDAPSTWDFIEAEWPDAVAVSLDGERARGWMMLSTLLEKTSEAVIVRFNRQVGGVIIEEE